MAWMMIVVPKYSNDKEKYEGSIKSKESRLFGPYKDKDDINSIRRDFGDPESKINDYWLFETFATQILKFRENE